MSTRTPNPPPGQLDFTSSGEGDTGEDSSGPRLYLVTNNLNLVDILSSGLLKPAAWYQKYYRDLGNSCPHALLLLKSHPSAALAQGSLEQGDITYPVILEIAADGLSGPAWVVSREYKVRKGKVTQHDNVVALLVNGAIPIGLVHAVYFRSDDELREFQARKYANMEPSRANVQLKAYPDAFCGSDVDGEQLIVAITSACKKIPSPSPEIIPIMDSITGVMYLLGRYASEDVEFPLQVYGAAVNQFINADEKLLPDAAVPDEYLWVRGILDALPPRLPEGEGPVPEPTPADTAREVFCRLAVREAIAVKPADFAPDAFVRSILNNFEEELKLLEMPSYEEQLARYRAAATMLLDVRTGLAGLDDFFAKYPTDELPCLAGLFLFLSENRPQEAIKTWSQYPEFPALARAFSVALVGALQGRARLDLAVRPGFQLSYLLDMASVFWINSIIDSIHLVEFAQPASVTSTETGQGKDETLLIGTEALITRFISAKKPELPRAEGPKAVTPRAEPSRLSAGTGPLSRNAPPADWRSNASKPSQREVPMDKIIQRLQNSDMSIPGTPILGLAIQICRQSRWEDLISTCVPLRDRDYILESHSTKHEIRLPGYVVPEYRLTQPDEFKKRLAGLSDDRLRQILNSQQLSYLVGRVTGSLQSTGE